MISALFYLQYHSMRNRLWARLRRLKRPKYLIGAIIGGLYFIFYFSMLVTGPSPGVSGTSLASVAPTPSAWTTFGAILLFLVVVLAWILPNERAALAFSEAEVAFLFPAPISRRGLIHYKLVRSQVGILFSVVFLTLISGRWRQGPHVWISLLGWWTILSTLSLHGLASSFARTFLFDRGITNWRRRTIILSALVVVIGGLFIVGRDRLPPLPAGPNPIPYDYLNWLDTALTTGAIPYLLLPFRVVVQPYFAPDASSFFLALGPALAIIALHYFIVVRANVAFEEASVAYSQKIASRIANMQQRRGTPQAPKKARRAPFQLKPIGPPAVAFLWKNLILAGTSANPRLFFRVFLLIFIFGSFALPRNNGDVPWTFAIGIVCLGLLFISLLAGPSLLRVDFRADLLVADQLMLYPLPGWQIVLGELLAPVAVLTAVQWLLILAVAMFTTVPAHEIHVVTDSADTQTTVAAHGLALGLRVSLALTAAILVPAIDFIMLLIPNAVALLMPSWVRFDKNAPRGIENFGQMIILAIGQFFVMAVALVPAGLIFWLAFFLVGLVLDSAVAMPLAAVAAATMLVVEGSAALFILGQAFERFDISAETTN